LKKEKTTASLNIYKVLPKVELHRHLEGSLRIATMLEIAEQHGVTVPPRIVDLSSLVQVQDEEPFTFTNFLEKFKTLRLFYRSPEVIDRITREAIEDAARDNVRYMELRFTPVALSRAEGFPLHDVMAWVCNSTRKAADEFGIRVRLIASVNRHESIELAEQVAWLAASHIRDGILGLDLAGNEAEYPAPPFEGIFKEARQSGLKTTIHAGEWGGAGNVAEAIQRFDADRIGHGVRVLEDPSVVELAREHRTVFEVCITSNYQSGVVPALSAHPLTRMLQSGLNATLNTDDPSVSRITLTHEFKLAADDLGLPFDVLKERVLAAANAAFLPDDERTALVTEIESKLARL
jgi:adenosine deaminase